MTIGKSQAASDARKAYLKEWRRNNRDKVRQYQERYWVRRAEKAAEKETANATE